MYTFIAITLLLLSSVVAVLLYYQLKSKRLQSFKSGICPNCGAAPTKFYDSFKEITISKKPISSKILRSNGCSGGVEIEYYCKECEIKEVFNESGAGCGI